MALSPDLQEQIATRLRLALGLFETVTITSSSSEYDIRNGLSRLYYAFFHASLGLLTSTEPDIAAVSKDHGMVHTRVQRRFGKTLSITRTIRQLYDLRRQADYEGDMF